MKNITFVNFPLETNPLGNYLKNQCSSTTMSNSEINPKCSTVGTLLYKLWHINMKIHYIAINITNM